MENISPTHCCNRCAGGEGHDPLWCAGVPGNWLKAVKVPSSDPSAPPVTAHALVLLPEGGSAVGPAPAVLWLHGAMTYVWPETMAQDLDFVRKNNVAARNFVFIAPFATDGEVLAKVSSYRRKNDRFGNDRAYGETFDIQKTWECFQAVCEALGPEVVDFDRRSVTGLSMGGQATWHVALRYGSQLAAIAPMAGACKWPEHCYDKADVANQMKHVSIRTYSMKPDTGSFSWKDLEWVAKIRGCQRVAQEKEGTLPEARSRNKWRKAADSFTDYLWPDLAAVAAAPSASSQSNNGSTWSYKDGYGPFYGNGDASSSCRSCAGWDPAARAPMDFGVCLQLTLLSGGEDEHNCWDIVYSQENTFGLFTWLASCRRCVAKPKPKESSAAVSVAATEAPSAAAAATSTAATTDDSGTGTGGSTSTNWASSTWKWWSSWSDAADSRWDWNRSSKHGDTDPTWEGAPNENDAATPMCWTVESSGEVAEDRQGQ